MAYKPNWPGPMTYMEVPPLGKSAVNGTGPYPKLKRPATADFLRAKPKPWRIVDIASDIDAARALQEARSGLLSAEMAIPSDVPPDERDLRLAGLRLHLDDCRARVEESTRQLLVAGIGRVAKDKLAGEHPPRDEDHERAKKEGARRAEYNLDTFPVALMAASLVEPKLTPEEVDEITSEWTEGEFVVLWIAVQQVNADSQLVTLGKGSSGTTGS